MSTSRAYATATATEESEYDLEPSQLKMIFLRCLPGSQRAIQEDRPILASIAFPPVEYEDTNVERNRW
jgi:hypothetical protein